MDDTNPDDTDVSRREPQPDALPGSPHLAVRQVDPGLAAVHGLWIGAVAGAAVLGAVGALLLVTALAAGYVPARKAASVQPIQALRAE